MTAKLILSTFLAAALTAPVQASQVELNVQRQSLSAVLKDVSQRSGTEIILAGDLAKDRISTTVSEADWNAAIQTLLADYNYEAQWNASGAMRRVIVSGRNGNGTVSQDARSSSAGGEMLSYEPLPQLMPEKFRGLNAGSVMLISLSLKDLLSMELGDRIGLTLPGGRYEIVHDNRFEHDNGDVTWVGYVENAGQAYRVIVTSGVDGGIGQIVTPDGVYNIDSQDGRTWLVDLNASGLLVSSLENDDTDPGSLESAVTLEARARRTARSRTTIKTNADTTTQASVALNSVPVVDLLVLYTQGVQGGTNISTRINNLVAKANQAYVDSKINLKLRVVYSALVSYTEANSNDTALGDLTNGRSAFANVSALRAQFGADLVTLVRPFSYKSQLSCGVAWVNGAGGGNMSAKYGFSVVSDGIDPAGSYYCSDFTLAHELGHNMGSAHDLAHSNVQGRYPYSYGYGAVGKFGTIMSYYNPTLGYFSSPNLTSNKQVLGTSTANNVQSLNLTGPVVAAFASTVVQ